MQLCKCIVSIYYVQQSTQVLSLFPFFPFPFSLFHINWLKYLNGKYVWLCKASMTYANALHSHSYAFSLSSSSFFWYTVSVRIIKRCLIELKFLSENIDLVNIRLSFPNFSTESKLVEIWWEHYWLAIISLN